MADQTETETEVAEEKKGGGKKKIIMIVVGLAVGAFVAKTFFLKPPPPTAAALKAESMTSTLDTWATCARDNEVAFDIAAATGEFETWYAQHEAHDAIAEAPAAGETHEGAGLGGGLGMKARVASGGGAAPTGPVILTLDAITINLAEEHYLKVGVALELAEGTDPEAARTAGAGAPAQDKVIEVLSGRTVEDLTPTETRTAIRQQLGNDLCKSSMGAIKKLYFTDFVMQ